MLGDMQTSDDRGRVDGIFRIWSTRVEGSSPHVIQSMYTGEEKPQDFKTQDTL